jgi:hypothetical protein
MNPSESEADLVEIPAEGPRAWRRLKAGLLVEAGRGERPLVKRWQELARSGGFDADQASAELLSASPVPDDDPALLARSARLCLDLWMAPTLRGAQGALRGVRQAGRNLFAYVFAQLLILALFSLLFGAGLLLLRLYGTPIEAPLDRVLGLVGLRAGQAGE